MLKLTLFLSLLFFGNSAFAGFPTIWKFVNLSSHKVFLKCTGTSKGLTHPLVLNKILLTVESTNRFKWSQYHNDGFGLKETSWICKIDNKKIYFNTTIGEDISIVIGNNNTKVIRDL